MRMIRMSVLAVSAMATSATAQLPPPGPGGPQMVPVRRMRMATPPPAFVGDNAQVPIDLSKVMPVVEVMIGGQPHRFAVDTGAGGHGRIKPDLAAALGLPVTGEALAADGSGQTQTRKTYRIESLDLGGVKFSGVDVAEAGRLPEGVEGVLGLGLFASHLLTLDYPRAMLSLSRKALPVSAFAYAPDPRGITVPLTIGTETIPTHIDTGNSIAPLILPTALAERLPRKGEPRVVGRAGTAISTVEIKQIDLNVPVRLGKMTLPISTVSYPSLGEAGNLGSKGLASSTLRIDQVNHRIAIEASSAKKKR